MLTGPQLRSAAMSICAAIIAVGLQGCSSGESTRPTDPPPTDPPTNPPTQDSGLDARPQNATCLAWPRPGVGSDISLARYTDLTFDSPIAMLQPDDGSHWFVVEQDGVVRRFQADNPAATLATFIDISARVASGGEMGLLGMAFHPDYPTDRRVFLSYTASSPRRSLISEFTLAAGDATLDPGSERVLLTIDQPESNHNGGHIAFGPDGFLHIGIGDGGGGGDQHGAIGNGQNLQTLLGKMIRIDVSDTSGAVRYRIPPTNPFPGGAFCNINGVTTAAQCAEIYAFGFRNPWRWSFDRESDELWVADVGQGSWEEVNRVTPGGNYGWRCREGAHDFNPETSGCNTADLIDPVAEYDHSQGVSITGGYVYRGAQPTNLAGKYLFGDFSSGRIWTTADGTRVPTELLDSDLSISSFGEGADAEIYVVDYSGGLYRIVFEAGAGGGSAPTNLSGTGCVDPDDPTQPANGLIPYEINAPFWSDGASKDRWLALPDGERITVQADGDWQFPNRSVLMKNFRIGAQLIETRLFMRHPDGAWGGFTYEWNEQQTDATLVQGGATRDIDGQQWIFPSESQCMECHTSAAGRSLGIETAQLNRDLTYPQTGRTANELFTLNHIGVLTPAITDPASQPAMPDPADAGADLSARARAYLHTNCSQCHRPGGPTGAGMDLRYTTALSMTNACDVQPQSGDLGLGANARLIAPGSAANSIIVNRMDRRDEHAMPPLASNRVDAAGVALLTQWIDGLDGC